MKVPIPQAFTRSLVCCCLAGVLALSSTLARAGSFTPVSREEARTVAVHWLSSQLAEAESRPEINGVSPLFNAQRTRHIGWVADLAPRGHVLLPVYRELSPVYGFSLESELPLQGGHQATAWFRGTLASSLKRLESLRNDPRAQERFDANRALWEHWLSLGSRAEVQGVPVLDFAYRESLLNKRVYSGTAPLAGETPPDYPGDYQKPLSWHSGAPYNRKAPIVQTVPEEIWVDLDASGTYTEGDVGGDLKAYDADGTWMTPSDPPEHGFQGDLFFFDDDADSSYSYTAIDDESYILSGGEWIWRDENDDSVYTYGIDQPVYPPLDEGNQSDWQDRSGTEGIQGNLYYTSSIGDNRYTYTETHTRPGSYVAAIGMLTRYWEWPKTGLGSHAYDWAYHEGGQDSDLYVQLSADFDHAYNWPRMPLNNLFLASAAEQDNVARLLYDIGVAFEVDFQLDTPLIDVSQSAMERFAHHFRYNRHAIQYLQRSNTAGDDEWFAEIAEEIDAKRPVVLQAFGAETFISPIVDGYLKGSGYTNDPNQDSANANMYLLHCNLGGSAHWWAMDNIDGIPYGEPGDAQTALIEQTATAGIAPQRVPQTVVAEAFVEEGAAGTAEFQEALKQMQNRKGQRFLSLVYHPKATDPYYLGDHDPSQDRLLQRMAAYGVDTGTSQPLALLNGNTDDPVMGQQDALADQLDLYAAYQRRTVEPSRYRIVGDSVIGSSPDENRPLCKADIYITRLDEDIPESETLTLTSVLAEKVNNGAHWVVREFLDSREIEFGYGLTRIANITQLPELPEADWDLSAARIIVLLQRADGSVLQAARLQHFAPGPNYQIVEGLGLYRATLVNQAPRAPSEVLLTQTTSAAGDSRLHAEALGACDADGDAIRYAYSWFKNGIRQTDLHGVTTDSSVTVTDPNLSADSLWYCEVRVFDEYYAEGAGIEKAANHSSPAMLSNPLLVTHGQAPQNNQVPTAPAFVEISPDNASEGDTLTCLAAAPSDPDGDAVNLIYAWYKNGALQTAHSAPSLPYGALAAGETWHCEVTAQDMWGARSTTLASAEITIAAARNNPPTAPLYVSLGPGEPSYISTLSCGRPVGITSNSGEPYEIHYRWWRMQGQSWRPTENTGVIGADDEWVCRVAMTWEDIGSLWRCEIFARNTVSGANGPAYTTESLLVRNKVPNTPTAYVTPQFAKLDEDLRCIASGGSDAEDVDNTRYYFEWLVNGEPSRIAGFGQNTVDASFTSSGEAWTCRVYAQDTLGGRSEAVSASGDIFIGSPPTPAGKAVVSPRRPEADETVVCTASGAIDPDGQPITYHYTWYVEQKLTSTGQLAPESPEALPDNRQNWYWTEAYTGASLLPGVTEYGQRYSCFVTASDGDFTSSGVASPSIIIGNQAPSKPAIQVTPSHPRPGESMTCDILSESSDLEGDAFSYAFEWFTTDSAERQYLGASLPAGRTSLGQTWYCQVTVTDRPPGDLPPASSTVQSDEFPFVSVPPTAPTEVRITPSAPKSADDLSCSASGSIDPNGDAITYAFRWEKNPGSGWEETAFDSALLPAANTAEGEQWRCVVLARDTNGLQSDSVAASAVTVGNQAPTQPGTPEITPEPAGIEEDLVCAADGSSDPNGDPITYEFQWYRHRPSAESSPQAIAGARKATLARDLLAYGDTWFCQVRASDGITFSDWVSSRPLTIANLPPAPPSSVSLTPESPTSIQDIVCTASGSSDPEGSAVFYSYTWKRNGEISEFSAQTLAAGSTTTGESWDCEVRAVDEAGNTSRAVAAGSVTVVAPNPGAPSVSIGPENPTRYDELICQASGATDPAGQALSYTYIWSYRESGADASDWQAPAPEISGNTVSPSSLANGQSWRCAVFAENESGFRSPTVTGNEVVVRNRPPTAPESVELTLAPAENKAVCSMSGADDFEPFWYDVTWQKYQDGTWTTLSRTLGVSPGNEASLAPIAFDNSFYRCSVTARDEAGALSSPRLSNVVQAASGLPAKPAVEISADGRRLSCTAAVTAPAEDRLLVFSWFRNGFPTPYSSADEDGSDGFSDSIVVPPSTLDELWSCRVYAIDTNTKARSEAVTALLPAATYENKAPSEPEVILIPAQPRSSNDLRARIQTRAVDPEGDAIVYHYNWYRDGELFKEHSGPVLDASETTTGETWECRVIARDRHGGAVAVPAMAAVTIEALNGLDQYENDDSWLLASPLQDGAGQSHNIGAATDPDWISFEVIRKAEVSLDWILVQGDPDITVSVYSQAGVPDTALKTASSSPLTLSNLAAGSYYVKIDGRWGLPHDSLASYPVYTLTLSITPEVIDNRAPAQPDSVQIRPAAPIPGDPLRAIAQGASDPDGDTLGHIYHWYQNGSFRPALSGANAATVPAAATLFGDDWHCQVQVRDPAGDRSAFAQSETVTVGNAADWSVSLDVTAALRSSLAMDPDAVAALTSPLTFGQAAAATDGWDEGLDDAAPPTNADTNVPYLAFTGSPQLQSDIRSIEAARKTWIVRIDMTDPLEQSITLSWDPDSLPERGLLQMRDNATGELVNMREANQITVDDKDPADLVHDLEISCDARYVSDVLIDEDQGAGWHLFSLTLDGPFESASEVLGHATLGSAWQYNAETGRYESAGELSAGRAYWAYVPQPATVEYLGQPALSSTLELQAGWNLVGVTTTAPLPAHPDIDRGLIYSWDADSQSYESAKVLKAGGSYWIFATKSVTLALE